MFWSLMASIRDDELRPRMGTFSTLASSVAGPALIVWHEICFAHAKRFLSHAHQRELLHRSYTRMNPSVLPFLGHAAVPCFSLICGWEVLR